MSDDRAQPALVPVILSGGSGTRLWPVSRRAHPKPFMRLLDGETMAEKTLRRALNVTDGTPALTVTSRDFYFYTRDLYANVREDAAGFPFLLEPVGCNTAPAIAMAARMVAAQHGADALGFRVGQVEALAVQPRQVRDVVQRRGHEVHRHDVDAPALDAQRRHPRRHHAAHLLDQLEEVVRPVDLVDDAGFRVPDDDSRSVDAPRNRTFLPDQAFRIVLGAEIGVFQPARLFEHVLAENARVQAGGGDRADVVEAPCLDVGGKADGVARAVKIDPHLVLGLRHQVIDRAEVEHLADLALELAPLTTNQVIDVQGAQILRIRNALGSGYIDIQNVGALGINDLLLSKTGSTSSVDYQIGAWDHNDNRFLRPVLDDLERLLAKLAPRQRAVLHLTVVEGLSDSEIAEILGIAGSSVRVHRLRGRRHLEQLVARGRK